MPGTQYGMRPLRRAPARPVQSKTSDQQGVVDGLARMACSVCAITYLNPAGLRAVCPLCEERKFTSDLRNNIEKLSNANTILTAENGRLKLRVDAATMLAETVAIVEGEDLVWLKAAAYQRATDPGKASLRAFRATPRGPVLGFSLALRGRAKDHHTCRSVGGIALAQTFEEVCKTVGVRQGVEMLVRCLTPHLTGDVE